MIPYVIYSRKSLEDDDKQIQSIPSQEDEMKSVATKCNLSVITPFLSESKSAKAPGRPVFDAMMKKVERGDIKGILCWKLDRLARNPVDGGRIIWAIKQHGLIIRTPHQTFSQAEDNLILMYIEFGMAQKYVDDLSRNTTRGLEAKAKKGWLPGVAPMGYSNSKVEERGQKTILRDPDRFEAVRRMWDLILTGDFNPARIQKIANEEWGFRTRQTKRTGGKPLARSTIYKIFSDPFYYGQFEYPEGSGRWYQGQHEPMITRAEFECVQKLLHQKANPRPHKEFGLLFRGLIKCGECGSSITAHVKEQVRCTRCGFKSSVKKRDSCFKCGLPISSMKNPKIRQYAYYHCTRTLNSFCREKCISSTALEKQLTNKLNAFSLAPDLRDWGLKYIDKLRDQEFSRKALIMAERKKTYERCILQLENLVKLKTAPENADSSLLSDEEYQKQRANLLVQKSALGSEASTFEMGVTEKMHVAKAALELVGSIQERPLDDDSQAKREVLSALGLNHVLKQKELEIKPEFPFSELPQRPKCDHRDLSPIEPENNQTDKGLNGAFNSACLSPVPDVYEVRTKSLKISLESIWKKLDPDSPVFKRFPFDRDKPVVPGRERGMKGRSSPIPRSTRE
jgi:site-specific DNA recombinase